MESTGELVVDTSLSHLPQRNGKDVQQILPCGSRVLVNNEIDVASVTRAFSREKKDEYGRDIDLRESFSEEDKAEEMETLEEVSDDAPSAVARSSRSGGRAASHVRTCG